MSAPTRPQQRVFATAIVCAVAIGAERLMTGAEILNWALVGGLAAIPLLWPWLLKGLGQHARSLPPAMPELLPDGKMPLWWRYMEVYLVVAAVAWVALLFASSIPSIPPKVSLSILILDCAGPVLMVGITTLVKHFGGVGSPKGA